MSCSRLWSEGLRAVRASGEFDRIYQRWLDPYTDSADGLPAWLLWSAAVVVLGLALLAIWQMLRLARSLAAHRRASERLDYLACHDPLTGLLNRIEFERRLEDALRSGKPGNRSHSLLILDLDQFRTINEEFGYTRGDESLCRIAGIIRDQLAPGEMAARLGGDEFAIFLPDTDPETGRHRAESLHNEIGQIWIGEDGPEPVQLRLSIGIVSAGEAELGGQSVIELLLRRGDAACVAAKQAGRNRVHVWTRDDTRLAELDGAQRWARRIQAALDENRLQAWWQPVVPLNERVRDPLYVEILVRMLTPEGQVVAAGEFMPAAERYFLADRVDRWVVDATLSWLSAEPGRVALADTFAINLSGRSLGDTQFLSWLESRMLGSEIPLERLCLEVTETALISHLPRARNVLDRLHERGCRIALDDFGVGVSSMGYLRELPVDFLKIDGSFIRDLPRGGAALEMVRHIHSLGRSMGKVTIAEQVEDDAVREILGRVEVDRIQGYTVARPATLDSLEAWTRRWLSGQAASVGQL